MSRTHQNENRSDKFSGLIKADESYFSRGFRSRLLPVISVRFPSRSCRATPSSSASRFAFPSFSVTFAVWVLTPGVSMSRVSVTSFRLSTHCFVHLDQDHIRVVERDAQQAFHSELGLVEQCVDAQRCQRLSDSMLHLFFFPPRQAHRVVSNNQIKQKVLWKEKWP